MRNFLIVLKYTILENARKKTFIITNVILVLLTILLFNINNIADAFSSDNTNNNTSSDIKKIAIVDDSNLYSQYLNNYKIPSTNYTLVKTDIKKNNDLKEEIKNNKIDAAVIIDTEKGLPTFKYLVKDENNMLNADTIGTIIKSTYMSIALQPYKVDQPTMVNLNTPVTYEIEQANGEAASLGSYIISIIMSILLYFAIYFYGYSVSLSISNEKTSRVMETLVTSTKPSSIVLGKTIAMGILGLAQLLLLLLTSLISYKIFVGKDFVMLGEKVDLSSITPALLLMLIVYFILGYFLYAMLNAVAGSTVSKAEDLHSAAMPVSFVSLMSFYLGYFSLMNPMSSVNTFASIMPFSSVFTMPSRMIMSTVPMWQILLSIVLLLGTIALLAVVSVKIYSAAILHYGEKLSVKALFKMSKNN
jgi:ABC-2 type transport system permease protein